MRTGHTTPDAAATGTGAAPRLSEAGPGATAIASTLAAFAVRFEVALGRCRGADDADAIHDARVAARRLESALRVWRDALAPRIRRATLRRLQRWRRRLARARDLEVFADVLADPSLAGSDSERDALAALRTRTEGRRDRARGRIAKRLDAHRMERLSAWLGRVAPAVAPGADALQAAMSRCARAERSADAALAAAWESTDDHALHEARLAVKRRRYAADGLSAVLGLPPGTVSASSRALQRALGEVHDRAVVRDRLRRRARKHPEHSAALHSVAARVEHSRHESLAAFRALRPATAAGG